MADHAGVRGASETREAHVERVRRQSDAVVRRSRQANFLFPGFAFVIGGWVFSATLFFNYIS